MQRYNSCIAPNELDDTLETVTDAVLTASRVLMAVVARSLREHEGDVSIQQYRTLVVLAQRGAQRPVDLAATLGVDPSTVTRLCDRLERKGMISRVRDGADRREVRLRLSARGAALVRSVTRRRREEIRRILEALSPAQRGALVDALGSFSAAAGEVAERDWPRFWEL